jgi:hypothetical protein
MSKRVKTFWCEPTNRRKQFLRRFVFTSDDGKCDSPDTWGYHQAWVPIEDAEFAWEPCRWAEAHTDCEGHPASPPEISHDDPRWPKVCPCGREFKDADQWQVFTDTIYVRPDTKEEFPQRDLPPGATFDANWMHKWYEGSDGLSVHIMLPNKLLWNVDGRANNCTRPEDKEHKCWVRRGDPKAGTLTISKEGKTCDAGAGSIQAGNYHGFLRDGYLEEC